MLYVSTRPLKTSESCHVTIFFTPIVLVWWRKSCVLYAEENSALSCIHQDALKGVPTRMLLLESTWVDLWPKDNLFVFVRKDESAPLADQLHEMKFGCDVSHILHPIISTSGAYCEVVQRASGTIGRSPLNISPSCSTLVGRR